MPHLKEVCLSPTKELQEACINMASDGSECIRVANTSLLQVLSKENVIQQLKTWESQKSSVQVNDELPPPGQSHFVIR